MIWLWNLTAGCFHFLSSQSVSCDIRGLVEKTVHNLSEASYSRSYCFQYCAQGLINEQLVRTWQLSRSTDLRQWFKHSTHECNSHYIIIFPYIISVILFAGVHQSQTYLAPHTYGITRLDSKLIRMFLTARIKVIGEC